MFQLLDEKQECVGLYKNGEIVYSDTDLQLDKTWTYAPSLKGKDIDYAAIFAQGKTLDEVCPEHLKKDWENINKKVRAHISSFLVAKINLKQNCFLDLVPQRFLKEYSELKNRICEHVFRTYQKPSEYTFYREFTELLYDIGSRDLQLNKNRITERLYHPQGKKLWEKVNNGNTSIKYNMFSSVTGRLTTTDRSFPILTLPVGYRDIIIPQNDWFVALDLNAAEMRVALALSGQDQPDGDLHEHVREVVFNNELTRAQAKSISTQWLYDARNEDTKKYDENLSKFYSKSKLFTNFWRNGIVSTPYSRNISADAHHVISYLCQSTLIDLFHRQLIKVFHLLDGMKTRIAFMVHDQVVFDLKEDEKKILPEIIKTISNTPYGTFPAKVEIGPNFYDMKKVNIKV